MSTGGSDDRTDPSSLGPVGGGARHRLLAGGRLGRRGLSRRHRQRDGLELRRHRHQRLGLADLHDAGHQRELPELVVGARPRELRPEPRGLRRLGDRLLGGADPDGSAVWLSVPAERGRRGVPDVQRLGVDRPAGERAAALAGGDRRDVHGHHPQVERPGDHRAQPDSAAPQHATRGDLPGRCVRGQLHLLELHPEHAACGLGRVHRSHGRT